MKKYKKAVIELEKFEYVIDGNHPDCMNYKIFCNDVDVSSQITQLIRINMDEFNKIKK